MRAVVVLWSKPDCQQCKAVERTLERAKVNFRISDLTAPENAQALAQFKSRGILAAPVTTFEDIELSGFDPSGLASLILAYDSAKLASLREAKVA
jgi:glutaredoxin-like protein NrdH